MPAPARTDNYIHIVAVASWGSLFRLTHREPDMIVTPFIIKEVERKVSDEKRVGTVVRRDAGARFTIRGDWINKWLFHSHRI